MGPVPGDHVLTRPAEPPDAVLRYAAHDDGVVDVHLPAERLRGRRPRPLVVNVHGGFWRQEYDRVPARPFAHGLVAAGFVVANLEYRRGPGGWPATAEDLDTALAALPRLLAGIGVETTGVTLTGHSAGGHLVLWLANRPHPVERVVALAPVADLHAGAEHDWVRAATEDFLGGTRDELPEVYDAADPALRLSRRPEASVVVVHGDRDEDVPVGLSRGLAARFGWLDYRELPGADHFDVIDPRSAWWTSVLDAVRG